MPDNQYPPFPSDSGAITVPRQLIRWIDINPQGGALRRCQTFVTMPAFATNTAFSQISDIVASFNYECSNNLSLVGYTVPSSPNYVLCISYHIGAQVTRYKLWDATGSVIAAIPYYTGQPIKKNFRLEVWNTTQGLASDNAAHTFYTSVLQTVDYRFGTDSALANNDGQVNTFTSNGLTLPLTFPSNSVSVTN